MISITRIKWLVADTISGATTADAGASTADAGTEKKSQQFTSKILYQ